MGHNPVHGTLSSSFIVLEALADWGIEGLLLKKEAPKECCPEWINEGLERADSHDHTRKIICFIRPCPPTTLKV
jgi:hypothetical protein